MPYKIIIFDADRTLFDFDQSEEVAFKKLLKHTGQSEDFSTLFPLYIKINEETWAELEQGLMTQETLKTERFKRFLDAANIKGDPIEYASIFTKHLADASILFDQAFEIIESLSKKYRLVIITNGLKEVQNQRIRQSVLSPFIETTVISDEIGMMKPDPKIIDHTLDLIGNPKKEDLVIIGDSLSSDIQCGLNAGIDTIWYNPNNKENTLDKAPTYTISTLNDLLEII